MELDLNIVRQCITKALQEDQVENDITTKSLFPKKFNIRCIIEAHQEGIICGLPVVREIFNMLSDKVKFSPNFKDGDYIKSKDIILKVSGPGSGILSFERIVLNFLSHLSGIATLTSKFVNLVKQYDVKIMDTRKTIPGLRHLEKYAVYIGGGQNHRMDLSQMFLIKDNHIKLLSGKISKQGLYNAIIEKLRKKYPNKKIEIEVENLDQFKEVFLAYPDVIMLDNMKPEDIKQAVKIKNDLFSQDENLKPIKLEASGGINIQNVKHYARTGVDRISIGALTNSAPGLDFSMKVK